MLPDEGWGRLRSGVPGESTWIVSQALVLEESQATLLPSSAIASIGPPGLLRRVCAVGDAAAAVPARTSSPAVARRTRTRGR